MKQTNGSMRLKQSDRVFRQSAGFLCLSLESKSKVLYDPFMCNSSLPSWKPKAIYHI